MHADRTHVDLGDDGKDGYEEAWNGFYISFDSRIEAFGQPRRQSAAWERPAVRSPRSEIFPKRIGQLVLTGAALGQATER